MLLPQVNGNAAKALLKTKKYVEKQGILKSNRHKAVNDNRHFTNRFSPQLWNKLRIPCSVTCLPWHWVIVNEIGAFLEICFNVSSLRSFLFFSVISFPEEGTKIKLLPTQDYRQIINGNFVMMIISNATMCTWLTWSHQLHNFFSYNHEESNKIENADPMERYIIFNKRWEY